jgi:hypothetical protein
LGAYRRDDWLPAELDALGEHLRGCADCRRLEAAYRQTGEHIRQLPTITPPASFRAAVFAAIRAEDAKLGRDIERVANDDTQPSLHAIRPARPPVRTWSQRGPVLGARAAIGVAAALLLGIGLMRLAPAVAAGAPSLASSVSGALSFGQAAGPHIVQYQVAPSTGQVAAAMASNHWLVYVASDAHGRSTLYARQRGTDAAFALPGAQASGEVTLRAVTDGWVVWQAGATSGDWALHASPLSQHGATLTLADSHSASALSGVWAQDSVVLATYTTPSDGSVLARYDLAPGHAASPTIVAYAQAASHRLADPSLAGGTYYWSEVWTDIGSGLHADIWRMDRSGNVQAVTSDGDAFAPHATSGALVWVQTGGSTSTSNADQVSGALRERSLSGGADHQLDANATVGSVQVSGALALWRDGSQTHTFDLAHGAPTLVDSSVRTASYANADEGTLTWGDAGSSTVNIYDGR